MIILKKFNNKGFVLVETVVVSAFVLMIFVLVFRNGVPMLEEYKKLENYDDVDSLYAANLVVDIFKANMENPNDEEAQKFYFDIIEKMSSSSAPDYIDLTDCNVWPDLNLCETVKLRTNITKDDKIYLTHSNPSRIKGKVLQNDRRFNGYIDYLDNSYNEDTVKGPYMFVITRTIEGNNPYLDEAEKEKFENVKVVKYGSIVFQ